MLGFLGFLVVGKKFGVHFFVAVVGPQPCCFGIDSCSRVVVVALEIVASSLVVDCSLGIEGSSMLAYVEIVLVLISTGIGSLYSVGNHFVVAGSFFVDFSWVFLFPNFGLNLVEHCLHFAFGLHLDVLGLNLLSIYVHEIVLAAPLDSVVPRFYPVLYF